MSDAPPGLRDHKHSLPPPQYGFVIRIEMQKERTPWGNDPIWRMKEEIWCDGDIVAIEERTMLDMAGAPILARQLEYMKEALLKTFERRENKEIR